jgi:signal transduction histidine kinase
MQSEETRLTACLNDIHALTQPRDATPERVDVGPLLRDIARLLRHEARIREAKLELDESPAPAWTFGDPHQLHLALLAFCACLVDAARPMSVITLRVGADGATGGTSVRIVATDIAMPVGVTSDFFRISGTASSDFQAVFAGRMIIEAHGGDVSLVGDDGAGSGFAIALPGRPAAAASAS